MQKIKALMTKLLLQLDALQHQIQSIDNQLFQYQEQLKKLEDMIVDACNADMHIHPEKEISRLSFTLKIQGERENIISASRVEKTELQRLMDKKIRVKKELKLLENYEEKYEKNLRVSAIKKEHLALDEWALRKEKTYEN